MPTSSSNSEQADHSREEFHRLFLQNQQRVFAYLMTLLANRADAEEVMQDVGVIVLSKADQWVPGTSFPRWACQIAHFEAMNFRRRKRKERLQFSDDLVRILAARHERASATLEDRREALANCLLRLRSGDRELILSRYQSQASAREFAECRGLSCNTVYKALTRIRRVLLECITRSTRSEEHLP